jgi:hypothetical protein
MELTRYSMPSLFSHAKPGEGIIVRMFLASAQDAPELTLFDARDVIAHLGPPLLHYAQPRRRVRYVQPQPTQQARETAAPLIASVVRVNRF